MVILTFGALQQVGAGLIYATVIVNAISCIGAYDGLITGLLTAANSLSGTIFTEIQTLYVNPDDLAPDSDGYFEEDEVLARLPPLFFVLGVVNGIMQLIAILLTFEASDDDLVLVLPDDGSMTNYLEGDGQVEAPGGDLTRSFGGGSLVSLGAAPHTTLSAAVKTPAFYLLAASFAFGAQPVYFMTALAKAYGAAFIDDDQFLALVTSVAAVANSLAAVFWGFLLDWRGFKDCAVLVNGLVALLFFTYVTPSTSWAVGHHKLFYAVWSFAIATANIGIFCLYLPEVYSRFGAKHATAIYGAIHFGPAIICFLSAPIIQTIVYHSWFWSLITTGGFAFSGT